MSQLTARFQNIYKINNVHFNIIGCGAIGSYTAIALARAGAKYFSLYDHDIVATVNIGVQHFNLNHVGKTKTNMLARQMHEINPRIKIKKQSAAYGPGMPYSRSYIHIPANVDTGITILGVDSMTARKSIVEYLIGQRFRNWFKDSYNDYTYGDRRFYDNDWMIDARMGSETFQSNLFKFPKTEEIEPPISIAEYEELMDQYRRMDYSNRDHGLQAKLDDYREQFTTLANRKVDELLENYWNTWYSDEDGDSEPCNARSTGYCASMAAAFINNQVRKIVDTNSLTNPEITFNFPSMTLVSDLDKSRLNM